MKTLLKKWQKLVNAIRGMWAWCAYAGTRAASVFVLIFSLLGVMFSVYGIVLAGFHVTMLACVVAVTVNIYMVILLLKDNLYYAKKWFPEYFE